MSRTTISAREFYSALMQITKDLVWKNSYKAAQNENDDYYFQIDQYMSSAKLLMTKYSPEYIIQILNHDKITFYGNDLLNINGVVNQITPEDMNTAIRIMYEYEEYNSYYRMLNGYPPYNCSDDYLVYPQFSYTGKENKPSVYDKNGNKIPIHLLEYDEKEKFLHSDEYKELMKNNTTGKYNYLEYMTVKKITPFVARDAKRFELLYLPISNPENLSRDFREVYNKCLLYIISIFYSDAYRNDQGEYYEGFIGMSILFMSLHQMYYKYLKADINREFYDLDSLKIVYEAYGIPFYDNIPLKYHKIIVKKINKLISYKGSNQVFIDLYEIFGYDILGIYKYYLFKERNFDANGNPITLYTEKKDNSGNIIYDELGKPIMVFDYEKMYNLFFLKSNINNNPYDDIQNKENVVDYDIIVDKDKYWLKNDIDTKKAVYENEYNFIDTKYIGVQVMFNLTDLLYETSYYLKSIFDNKKETKNILISHDILGIKIPLFDMVLYIFALICKKKGFEGNIPSKPEQVARVYGYNYKGILNKLKETSLTGFHIKKDYGPKDVFNPMDIKVGNTDFHGDTIQEWININSFLQNSIEGKEVYNAIINSFNKLIYSDLSSVNNIYKELNKLLKMIDNRLIYTHDRLEYSAYTELKRIMFTTELIKELYVKKNGEVAETYQDLLYDNNPSLWYRYNDIGEDIDNEIDYCLITLENLADELKCLEYVDGVDIDVITEYLYKLLRFFKSAKAELVDFDVLIKIDSRTDNLLKIMDFVKDIKDITWLDEINLFIKDNINSINDLSLIIDKFDLILKDYILSINSTELINEDFIICIDKLIKEIGNESLSKDILSLIQKHILVTDKINISTLNNIIELIKNIIDIERINDKINNGNLYDKLSNQFDNEKINDNSIINDKLINNSFDERINDNIGLSDKLICIEDLII